MILSTSIAMLVVHSYIAVEFALCCCPVCLDSINLIHGFFWTPPPPPFFKLRVTFIGEPGIDNGALKKELTEVVAGVERRFFEGGTTGKTPKYSITDVGSHNFKTIGEIFAVSIVQGGPPPNFFMPWCYDFISTGELDYGAVAEDDVADLDLKKQIQQIRAADDVDVLEIDKIVACGYTGPISIQKKEEIVEKGTVKRQRESKIINHLRDHIQDLEDKGADGEMEGEGHLPDAGNENKIDVGKFCQWLTGQSHIPLVSVPRAAPPAPSSDSQQQVWTVLNSALDISDILSDDLCFGEDGRLVTSTPNGTLPIFEDSLQLGPSIDAIANLISVPELMDMDLQPPSATASDPQPSATASDPQPSATASDPQPSATASDPQPSATASDPQPSATASDPQPSATASDPQPSATASDPQPSVTASDPQPSAPASDPQPSAPRMRPRAPCGVKCRRQCSTHFSEEQRMTICREFWGLSYKDKRAFVFHSVSQMGREKVCARPSRRGRTFVYRLKDAKENPHQVCKLFYLSTLGYHPGNDSIVLSVIGKEMSTALAPP
ncbi:unnamed protein product [Gadus morhua 'NCC']